MLFDHPRARSKMQKLATRVEAMIEQTKLAYLEQRQRIGSLVAASMTLILYVGKSVSDAVMQVKELEIQLKVRHRSAPACRGDHLQHLRRRAFDIHR